MVAVWPTNNGQHGNHGVDTRNTAHRALLASEKVFREGVEVDPAVAKVRGGNVGGVDRFADLPQLSLQAPMIFME